MNVTDCFEGDTNSVLKGIQHDLYSQLVGELFYRAKERYMSAARLLSVETEIMKVVADKHSFDHRVLQDSHDKIAAHYRFVHDNGGQPPLFPEGGSYEDHLRWSWTGFFHFEVRQLIEDDAIAREILRAVGYQNTEPGYAAEATLRGLLEDRYGNFHGTPPGSATTAEAGD